MKKLKFATITALVFSLALFTLPATTQAAVGDVGVGVDLNGVVFINVWVAPGTDPLDPANWMNDWSAPGDLWFEQYTAADGNTWQSWFGLNAFTDADTFVTSGDYFMSSNLNDGAGGQADFYEYNLNDVFETQTSLTNILSGYLELDFLHEDPLTFAGARYEEKEIYNEPSGSFIDNLWLWTDVDGDGFYDTAFESWNEFESGTGFKEVGFLEINWTANTFNLDNREENTLTGDYYQRTKAALDANNNAAAPGGVFDTDFLRNQDQSFPGNFSNVGEDFYRWKRDNMSAYDLEWSMREVTNDYPGIFTGGFASFIDDDQSGNMGSGAFNNSLDQRIDTDGDGLYDDWDWEGPNPGAYRTLDESGRFIGTINLTSARFRKWDAIENQYTDNQNQTWTSGWTTSSTNFQWDFNQDGFDQNEDFQETSSENLNFMGTNQVSHNKWDFVSDDLGTGVANRYAFSRTDWTVDGSFTQSEEEWIDNDNDGDLDDYAEKGAKYTSTSSSFLQYVGQTTSTSEMWDPGGDFDPVTGTFGTYTAFNSNSWIGGDSFSSSEFAKDTDNDGEIETGHQQDDLYITAFNNFGARQQATSSGARLTEDWANTRGAQQELNLFSSSIAPTGQFFETATGANSAGLVRTERGFDPDDGFAWEISETRTWGVNRVRFTNESYLGGDSLVLSELDQDTDANTSFQNQNDYEVFVNQFNEVEGNWNYVGYRILDNDNNTEVAQIQGFSTAYDFLFIEEDFGAGDTRDQFYWYASGDLAGGMMAKFGDVELTGALAASTTGLNVFFARYEWYPGASANPLDWYYLVEYDGPGII